MLRSTKLLVPCLQLVTDSAAGLFVQSYREASNLAIKPPPKYKPLKFGPGGRSSVSGNIATVFGATGFIGKYVVHELAKRGTQVVCPYRSNEEKAMPLKQMGDLGQIVPIKDFDLRNDEQVQYAIHRSNVIVNLIGASKETMNFSFEDVHTEWPARLAKFAAASPVCDRLLHFSDVAALPDHPARRMRSKAAGDKAVMDTFPRATLFRPAPVVGDEDTFYNTLLIQCKFGPAVPLVDGGKQRVQPTYIVDLVEAVHNALKRDDTVGKTYYLGGPEVLTLRQIVDLIYATLLEDEDETVTIPSWLGQPLLKPIDLMNRMMPQLLNFTLTSDAVAEATVDKVVPEAGVLTYRDLDVVPQKVTEGMAIEPIRYCRVGGYKLGDTEKIAKALPTKVRKYFGMETQEPRQY